MMSCLHYAIINSDPRIGKKKKELYIQFPPRRVKDTNMYDIESYPSVRNVMIMTPVMKI